MSEYSEKLKDPRWQKRRLEIMSRDNFACANCGREDQTLNVHHCYYERGRDPWDYGDSSLVTLCDNCHTEEHAKRRDQIDSLLCRIAQHGATWSEIGTLANIVADIPCDRQSLTDALASFSWLVYLSRKSPDFAKDFQSLVDRHISGLDVREG